MTVEPRQRQRQRLYNASTILLALALWGLCGLGSVALRALLSPWRGAATPSWASLGRWVKAALPLGDGHQRLAPHDLALVVRIAVVLARAVVMVARGGGGQAALASCACSVSCSRSRSAVLHALAQLLGPRV